MELASTLRWDWEKKRVGRSPKYRCAFYCTAFALLVLIHSGVVLTRVTNLTIALTFVLTVNPIPQNVKEDSDIHQCFLIWYAFVEEQNLNTL